MQKLILGGLICLFSFSLIHAQKYPSGVILKKTDKYQPGDTVTVYGKRVRAGDDYYLINSHYGDRFVSSNRVKVLDGNMDFWEKAWFENQAAHVRSKGWQLELRHSLEEDFTTYAAEMEMNGLIFRDEFLEDYMKQLLLIIHPLPLIKEEPTRLSMLIIKSSIPEAFVFDNGTIVLTTAEIARTRSEQELISLLTEMTAHMVLDHNLMNLDQAIQAQESAEFWTAFASIASAVAMEFSNFHYGTDFNVADWVLTGLSAAAVSDAIIKSTGSDFDTRQKKLAKQLRADYLALLQTDEQFEFLSDREYQINIASIISFSAWQEYNLNEYERSMKQLDRIFELGIANDEDYLLKAKLTRSMANTYESNQEALSYINRSLAINEVNNIEALAEKGIILLRMNEVADARQAFEQYKAAAAGMPGLPEGRDLTWANSMLIKCDQQLVSQ